MSRFRPSVLPLIALVTLLGGGCRPKSTAYSHPVSDGTIVLLRQGSTYGAFFMTNQTSSPELMDYRWFLRSDGKTTFNPSDPAVTGGVVTGARSVSFGPFKVDWSTAGHGGGYVYYPSEYFPGHRPGGVRKPGGASMAVTFEKDITKVDASSKEWDFRHRP